MLPTSGFQPVCWRQRIGLINISGFMNDFGFRYLLVGSSDQQFISVHNRELIESRALQPCAAIAAVRTGVLALLGSLLAEVHV